MPTTPPLLLEPLQGEFQRLVVLTTCLLLVRQGATAAGKVGLVPGSLSGRLLEMLASCLQAISCVSPARPLPTALRPPMLQAFGTAEVAVVKRRLGALLADPAMRLPDLATECLSLAGELLRVLTLGGQYLQMPTECSKGGPQRLFIGTASAPPASVAAAARRWGGE